MSDESTDSVDPADELLNRGVFLRKLREMERQDEAERAIVCDHESSATPDLLSIQLSSGDTILSYESFLANQQFYDDLKHVDHKYIDYGKFGTQSPLIVEQDKSIGKGGLCWDAAFILGEYLIQQLGGEPRERPLRVIELGSGTGVCGLMIGKAVEGLHVRLSDLPELIPLLKKNIDRNFSQNMEDLLQSEHLACGSYECDVRGSVSSTVLCWGNEDQEASEGKFDAIIGADIVATLYDPVALAKTMYNLSHVDSTVYVSFKERLSSVHRQFESAMSAYFGTLQFLDPPLSRNTNPDVRILIAKSRVEKPS